MWGVPQGSHGHGLELRSPKCAPEVTAGQVWHTKPHWLQSYFKLIKDTA